MTAPFIQRMTEENTQLVERLQALNAFVRGGNPVYAHLMEEEKVLLDLQQKTMQQYSSILMRRIQLATRKELANGQAPNS